MKGFCGLFLLLFLFVLNGLSQAGDFITIKKNGHNYKSFYKGAYAWFFTSEGEFVESRIIDIRNDSLFFKPIIVRRIPTAWGTTQPDTLATTIRSIYFKDIGGIPRKDQSFSYIKNGSLLMIGGAGYILLNLVNGAYLHDPPFSKRNLPGMAAATGVFAAGFIINKLHKPVIQIGKKYTVHYINLTTSKQ